MDKKEASCAILLAVGMAVFYIEGASMLAVLGTGGVLSYFLCPHLRFTYRSTMSCIKQQWWSLLLLFGVPTVAFIVSLWPLEAQPSFQTLLIDGIFFYLLVGCIEEFFCRGLLLTAFRTWMGSDFAALIFSSLIYGLFHLPSIWNGPLLLILMRVFWSIALGLYLGFLFLRSNNLLFVILVHALADWSTLVFFFSEQDWYPASAGAIVLLLYLSLGAYALVSFQDETCEKEEK